MTIYQQNWPDPGTTKLRQIQILGPVGDTDLVRFVPHPDPTDTYHLYDLTTCTFNLKWFWTCVSGTPVQHRKPVSPGVYVDA